jgi:hypothetical protein
MRVMAMWIRKRFSDLGKFGFSFKGTVSGEWIWLLMICVVSFRPKERTGHFVNFFKRSNDSITQKVQIFLAVNAS